MVFVFQKDNVWLHRDAFAHLYKPLCVAKTRIQIDPALASHSLFFGRRLIACEVFALLNGFGLTIRLFRTRRWKILEKVTRCLYWRPTHIRVASSGIRKVSAKNLCTRIANRSFISTHEINGREGLSNTRSAQIYRCAIPDRLVLLRNWVGHSFHGSSA